MQRCSNCGEYNDDSEDYCIYCGEIMYIQVENNSTSNDIKMDHLYADSLARELIDTNTNLFEDDMDEITREILGQKESTPVFLDDEIFLDNPEEENRDDELIELEKQLIRKLRRNKKLEAGMGLLIRNIEVILDDFNGPLEIIGEITTNDKLDNKSVQLSAISFDENQHQLTKNESIINVDHGNFKNFEITLNIDIDKTQLIILLPEMIQYDEEDNREIIEDIPEDDEKYVINDEVNNIFIEQLTDIERKIGMTISNTAVLIKSEHNIEVVGEIHIKNPDKYRNIKIAATCYDANNRIIGTSNTQINTKLFLGFDTLSLKIDNINVAQIQRIKLYPTLQ